VCGRTVSENLPKIPLFGPSFIHQLQLLGSQQHPQSGVLLTSFSTCLTNPFNPSRTPSLCFGVIGKTPGLISCNNLSALANAIMSLQDVTQSSLCSGIKVC
jgi:hypothetical protein